MTPARRPLQRFRLDISRCALYTIAVGIALLGCLAHVFFIVSTWAIFTHIIFELIRVA